MRASPNVHVRSHGSPTRYAADGSRRPCIEPLEGRVLLAAELVADLRQFTHDSDPSELVDAEGTLFFSADDDIHGTELWKSDGTAAGTALVKDVRPGVSSSVPHELTSLNGTVLFFAGDGVSGRELWRSDGTPDGTFLVKDIHPTGDSAFGRYLSPAGEERIAPAVIGGTMYFTAQDELNGFELWKTDGTTAGTVLVKDINPGADSSSPAQFVALGETLVFAASTASGRALWRSDGTAAGTVSLGVSRPVDLTVSGPIAYFTNGYGATPSPLSRTDGTGAGTFAVGPDGTHADNLADVNGTLYFESWTTNSGERELWKSDGTVEGTVRVAGPFRRISSLTNADGTVFFSGWTDSGAELWTSDGTESGTRRVRDLRPGAHDGVPYAAPMAGLNGAVLFAGTDGSTAQPALWRSDGTAAGTALLEEVGISTGTQAPPMVRSGDRVYFVVEREDVGVELWQSDGTPDGTGLVRDVNAVGRSSSPTTGVEYNGLLYFAATADGTTWSLWRTDGTATGTERVLDLPAANRVNPDSLVLLDGLIYFTALHPDGLQPALWRSDGTPGGTYPLLSVDGSDANFLHSRLIAAFDGDVFVAGASALWKTDGTREGTTRILNTAGPSFRWLTVVGDTLYFSGDGDDAGHELWKTDGTAAGTVRVTDLNPGIAASVPSELTAVGDTLYFAAGIADADVAGGVRYGIYGTDGTAPGTTLVRDFGRVTPTWLTALDQRLLFSVAPSVFSDGQLWSSDGTEGGTLPLQDHSQDGPSTVPAAVVVGAHAYFGGIDAAHGAELWRTDGTPEGTLLVADVVPGTAGSSAMPKFDANGQLFFTAITPEHGRELWRTDGSAAGTAMVHDLNPGPRNGNPTGFALANGALFFRAYHDAFGWELWRTHDLPQVGLTADPGARYHFETTASGLTLWIDQGTVTLGADLSQRYGELSLAVREGGAAVIKSSQSFARLEITDGDGTVRLDAAADQALLSVGALSLGDSAIVDLGRGGLRIAGGDEAVLGSLVARARNGSGGVWQGSGITSSIVDGIFGLGVGTRDGAVTIKYTYNGDANVDGVINADDYFRIDSGFLEQPQDPLYTQGDFNYDGTINADDYFLIDSAFLGQGAPFVSSTPATGMIAMDATTRALPAEPEQEEGRERSVRPIFSDQPMSVLGSARRQSVARRR